MALRLTPELLEGAYEYLRASEPFCNWKLPEGYGVGFQVTRHQDRYAHMVGYQRSKEAEIAISEKRVGSSHGLIEVMAHEMIHLHQHLRGTETSNTQHNAEFMRLARKVCLTHVFDPRAFV